MQLTLVDLDGFQLTLAVLICHALTGDSHVAGPAGPLTLSPAGDAHGLWRARVWDRP